MFDGVDDAFDRRLEEPSNLVAIKILSNGLSCCTIRNLNRYPSPLQREATISYPQLLIMVLVRPELDIVRLFAFDECVLGVSVESCDDSRDIRLESRVLEEFCNGLSEYQIAR